MEYASITEVWGDSFCKKEKSKGQKINPSKLYDNIIDSYIDDFDQSKNIKIKKQKTKLETDVQPFSSEKTFMDYDSYFSKTNLFPQDISDNITNAFEYENKIPESNETEIYDTVHEETDQDVIEEEQPHIENYVNNNYNYSNNIETSEEGVYGSRMYYQKQRNYKILDLILYVISGIFLIFMLEQVLKIGMVINSGQISR